MKIAILGDLIPTEILKVDPAIRALLQDTDLNIANLEAPFIRNGIRPTNGKSGLYQKTGNCDILKELNIRMVSLANNHIFDFGPMGLEYTRELLEKNGIRYFGAGTNETEALAAAGIAQGGETLSCRGFMCKYLSAFDAGKTEPGTAGIQAERITALLQNDKADHKILYMHWNQEFEDYPEPIYKNAAERILPYCRIIAGSHPHCIQGIFSREERHVFYSLGNFSVPNIEYYGCRISAYRPKSYVSFFPILSLSREGSEYALVPYTLSPDGAELYKASGEKAETILQKIRELSTPLALNADAYRKFYRQQRERKMRKPLTEDHRKNLRNLHRYRRKYQSFVNIERFVVYILDKLQLRKGVRRMFKAPIDRMQRTK